MSRLFQFLLPVIFFFSLSTAQAGPTQPPKPEVVSESISTPVALATDKSDRQIWALLLILGGAGLFFGTFRIAGGIKRSQATTLYLAKVYLSQKDYLWKS